MDISRREMITTVIVYAGRQDLVPLFTGLFFCTFLKNKTKQNTPLQNCNMVEVANVLWRSSCPTFLLMQGHLEQAAGVHVQRAFENLWAQRLHNPSGQHLLSSPCSQMTPKSIVSTGTRYENTHFWRGLIIYMVKKTAFYLGKHQVISVPQNRLQTV